MLSHYAKLLVSISATLAGVAIAFVGLGVAIFKSALFGLLIAILGGVLIWFTLAQERKGYARNVEAMNNETGCCFSEGFGYGGTSLRVDKTARKLALMLHGGGRYVLFDFSEIDDWELRWTEVSRNGSLSFQNVHFAFRTTRVEQPVFQVPIESKNNGEAWSQKLRLVLAWPNVVG